MNCQSYMYAFREGTETIHVHYYTEYKQPKTVLKLFGVGLGDQAVMQQIGVAFMEMIDPQLGNVCVSFGTTKTALKPWKGNYNIWWSWGDRPDWINYYLETVMFKPDLCLCPSRESERQIVDAGLNAMYCPLAAGTVFHPLYLKRNGLGYAGLDSKSEDQKRLTIKHYLSRLEWHGKTSWTTLDQVNRFYNSKLAVFGMINELSAELEILPNRIFETLATDTPLIFPKHKGFKELFGKEYPWQTSSPAETAQLINDIEQYPDNARVKAEEWGKLIRAEHNYKLRLQTIFQALKELK